MGNSDWHGFGRIHNYSVYADTFLKARYKFGPTRWLLLFNNYGAAALRKRGLLVFSPFGCEECAVCLLLLSIYVTDWVAMSWLVVPILLLGILSVSWSVVQQCIIQWCASDSQDRPALTLKVLYT
jgi:hypothetical protein